MAIIFFKQLDQLFIVLVPALVVWFDVVVAVSCPSEPDFVQTFLSIKSKSAIVLEGSLLTNPPP
jgi:hypothetical protein